MIVTLAGYTSPARPSGAPSPEVLCAAYARVSRSPLPLHRLREETCADVEGARQSLRRIVHHLGHQSVAEHAVFNFEVVGVSRLVTELLERSRLASYTERSQRYVRLEREFVLPREVDQAGLREPFLRLARDQYETYRELAAALAAGGHQRASREDARYALGLAVASQVAVTVNARALLGMIHRLETCGLHEGRTLGKRLRGLAHRVCPSLVPAESAQAEPASAGEDPWHSLSAPALLWYTPDPHRVLRQAMAFCGGDARASEAVQLAFLVELSAAAFAQLKRHRMTGLLTGPYDPGLGVTVPPLVEQAGMGGLIRDLAQGAEALFAAWRPLCGPAAPYALLNAHRRRVVVVINGRSLLHLARLRLDPHAQWDIRGVVAGMVRLVWDLLPETASLLGLPEVAADPGPRGP